MLLKTPLKSKLADLTIQNATVVEPGRPMEYYLFAIPHVSFKITAISFDLPDFLRPGPGEAPQFPIKMYPGQNFKLLYTFISPESGRYCGIIKVKILCEYEATELLLTEDIWTTVAPYTVAADPAGLEDELVDWFLKVANFYPRNGHIFLADYVLFFKDFLNIEIIPEIAAFLAEDFALPVEGLPVDPETRLQIILGLKTFYGIEAIHFEGHTACETAEEPFNPVLAREVPEVKGDDNA